MAPHCANRRNVLATAGGAVLAGLAGCSGLTEQSFEASTVVLPESARQEMVLAETGRDSETITREGPSGNVELSITSHAAVYRRGPARGRPTVLEQFVGSVNQTPGSGSAISALGTDLGIDEASLSFLEDTPTVAGDQFSVVLPEGARGGGELAVENTMALVPGAALDVGEIVFTGEEPGAFFPSDAFFPSEAFFPSDAFSPESPSGFRVFLPAVRSGKNGSERAERVEPGTTIETANTVFTPGAGNIWTGDTSPDPETAFDAGVMLPLGGQPFGVAALATPNASVAGQSANPLVGMDTAELLQQDAAKQVLAETGLTDADTVEWLAGPRALTDYPSPEGWDETELLGTGTDPEVFVGVVSGEDGPGPWGVFLIAARITDDDHVVAVGGIVRPVGTVDGGMTAVEGSGWGMDDRSGVTPPQPASAFTAEVFGALRRP